MDVDNDEPPLLLDDSDDNDELPPLNGYAYARYQDVMAIVRATRKPSYFITFTTSATSIQ